MAIPGLHNDLQSEIAGAWTVKTNSMGPLLTFLKRKTIKKIKMGEGSLLETLTRAPPPKRMLRELEG